MAHGGDDDAGETPDWTSPSDDSRGARVGSVVREVAVLVERENNEWCGGCGAWRGGTGAEPLPLLLLKRVRGERESRERNERVGGSGRAAVPKMGTRPGWPSPAHGHHAASEPWRGRPRRATVPTACRQVGSRRCLPSIF